MIFEQLREGILRVLTKRAGAESAKPALPPRQVLQQCPR